MVKTLLKALWIILMLLPIEAKGFNAMFSMATLIVSYQTGPKGERLDRVRFLIKDERQQRMYPKRDAFIADDEAECPARMVVIEDLPPGKYTLEFIVPNYDGFFEDVPPREITVPKEGLIKIDQVIIPWKQKP